MSNELPPLRISEGNADYLMRHIGRLTPTRSPQGENVVEFEIAEVLTKLLESVTNVDKVVKSLDALMQEVGQLQSPKESVSFYLKYIDTNRSGFNTAVGRIKNNLEKSQEDLQAYQQLLDQFENSPQFMNLSAQEDKQQIKQKIDQLKAEIQRIRGVDLDKIDRIANGILSKGEIVQILEDMD